MVPLTACVRNLGFIFDSNLSFSDHAFSVSRARFYHTSCGIKSILTYLLTYIRDLRHIRPVLDFDSARTIGTFLLNPDLPIAIRCYLPQTQLNRLQHILLVPLLQLRGPQSSPYSQIADTLHAQGTGAH